jgi:hypothetical protein
LPVEAAIFQFSHRSITRGQQLPATITRAKIIDDNGVTSITAVQPLHVPAWIEQQMARACSTQNC